MKRYSAILLLCLAQTSAFAHEAKEEPAKALGKGVLAASEEEGLRLASEPLATFGIKTLALEGAGPWRVPASARLFSLEEVNLYRQRDGFFRRIDFIEVQREGESLLIRSGALRAGDAVATEGIGYLRLIELNALGGEPAGHAH